MMTEWAMAHPWLTFWLAFFAIMAADNIGVDIARSRRPKP